jgi:hypothetical protein
MQRRWGKIHDAESLAGVGQGIYPAAANKCYLSVAGGHIQIRNMTNGSVRWEGLAPELPIQQVIFSRNYNRLSLLCKDGNIYRWKIEDHHPEASWNTFLVKFGMRELKDQITPGSPVQAPTNSRLNILSCH